LAGNIKKHIEKFADPYMVVNDITKQIVELTTDDIAQDYWFLILGYPGTGKSSLSIVFYKKLWKSLVTLMKKLRNGLIRI